MLEESQYLTSNGTTGHSNTNTMVLAQNRHTDQWTRTEDPEINPHSYSNVIRNKGAKNTLEKRYIFQQMVLGKLDIYL
jgi:hypothetical protein